MNDAQMLAALAALPEPELLQAGKITDPLGSNEFYSASMVVKILESAKDTEREACAKVCDEIAEHYGIDGGSVADHCAISIRKRSNAIELTGSPLASPATGVATLNVVVVGAWHPIETVPKDGTEVLVFGGGTYSVAHWDGDEFRDIGDIGWGGMYGVDNQPTHWMQLPEAPNAGPTRTPGWAPA